MKASWVKHLPTLVEVRKELAERSLREYVRFAWPIVEPAAPFIPNWHIDAICDHLEAVTRREIRNLLINIPPRCMKSLAVAVFWPTWVWIKAPAERWLFSSYAEALSIRDSLKCRRLIDSLWYQANWRDKYRLTSDQNQKGRFENDKTGYRPATSVGGTGTGEGGSFIVVDDPHNVKQAISDVERESALIWWDETMSTRLNDPGRDCKVIVMQRLHEADLSGHVLERGGYEHLCLPMEYEPKRHCVTSIGFKDPRGEEDELLWPERLSREAVDALKKDLGSYGAAGQLQQTPTPRGGKRFKREWFKPVKAAPVKAERCRFWDAAGTEGGGCYSAGVRMAQTDDGLYYIEHVIRDQWSSAKLHAVQKQTAQADGRAVRIREEQEPGSSGKDVIAAKTKELAGYDYQGKPATGDKELRWEPFAVQCEAGNVFIVEGPWNQDFLDEIEKVPTGRFKDQTDAASGAFTELALNAPQQYVF